MQELEGRPFVDALLDSEPNRLGDHQFRQAFFQHTGGHPLFVVELLRTLQERGSLVIDDAGRWVAKPSLDWQALPARVEGVIEQRIGRLHERETVRAPGRYGGAAETDIEVLTSPRRNSTMRSYQTPRMCLEGVLTP